MEFSDASCKWSGMDIRRRLDVGRGERGNYGRKMKRDSVKEI